MPNVTMSARTAAESAFGVITDSARALTYGTSALAELARTAAESAEALRVSTARNRFLDEERATERKLAELALEDHKHSAEISRQVGSDKASIEAFNQSMESYRSRLAAFDAKSTKLKAVA